MGQLLEKSDINALQPKKETMVCRVWSVEGWGGVQNMPVQGCEGGRGEGAAYQLRKTSGVKAMQINYGHGQISPLPSPAFHSA